MKLLITIMLVLFLSPVAAQTSGGYGKSGGYERSGGYETSGGYGRSGGYGKSGGYLSFKFQHDLTRRTNRKYSRRYDVQSDQASLKKGAWLRDQMMHTDKYRWLRQNERYINRQQKNMGGVYGRFGSDGNRFR